MRLPAPIAITAISAPRRKALVEQLPTADRFHRCCRSPIVVSFDYESFDDYWTSQATGPTRTAQRLQAMPVDRRDEIQHHVRLAYR